MFMQRERPKGCGGKGEAKGGWGKGGGQRGGGRGKASLSKSLDDYNDNSHLKYCIRSWHGHLFWLLTAESS